MKIPKKAKKVFKGILFETYQWGQEMYDGTTQTFEMLSRKPSSDVIATIDDKIIILLQEQPNKPLFHSLPGGRIEDGQNPEQAARAELLQETGYESENIKLIKEFTGNSKIYYHEYLFVAHNCKKTSTQNLDAGEKIKTSLIDFDSFLQLCRDEKFTAPLGFKFMMYEALIDENKKQELKNIIFNK